MCISVLSWKPDHGGGTSAVQGTVLGLWCVAAQTSHLCSTIYLPCSLRQSNFLLGEFSVLICRMGDWTSCVWLQGSEYKAMDIWVGAVWKDPLLLLQAMFWSGERLDRKLFQKLSGASPWPRAWSKFLTLLRSRAQCTRFSPSTGGWCEIGLGGR
jgi:hypothetical protein